MPPIILSDNDDNLARCARAISNGQPVAFPTETVYGLGADATCDIAVSSIFEIKKRPKFNPLIVHVANTAIARKIVEFDSRAEALADAFWPGPISLVLPRRENCGLSLLVSAGLDSVAVRVPCHPLAQKFLTRVARPIAAPSANPSEEISPTTALHVNYSFLTVSSSDSLLVLDGGACEVGLESSVVDLPGEKTVLLRPGGITDKAIETVTGKLTFAKNDDLTPKSPGMLSRHYAPSTPLRLNALSVKEGEILLGFGPTSDSTQFNLSRSGNLVEAAANLFAMLRALDAAAPTCIAVMPIPSEGLGLAINDRLTRAATPQFEPPDT